MTTSNDFKKSVSDKPRRSPHTMRTTRLAVVRMPENQYAYFLFWMMLSI
jgi:hypothetical protein